jgi:hypothetical protein
MTTYRKIVNTASQLENIALNFQAIKIHVANPSYQWMYLRVGANDSPTADNADLVVPPFSFSSYVVSPTNVFSILPVSLGTIPASINAFGRCVITFYDHDASLQTTFTTIRDDATYPIVESRLIPPVGLQILYNVTARNRLVLKKCQINVFSGTGTILIGFTSTTNGSFYINNPTIGIVHKMDFEPSGLYSFAGDPLRISLPATFGNASVTYTIATIPA